MSSANHPPAGVSKPAGAVSPTRIGSLIVTGKEAAAAAAAQMSLPRPSVGALAKPEPKLAAGTSGVPSPLKSGELVM